MGSDRDIDGTRSLTSIMRDGVTRLAGIDTAQLDARVLLKFVTGFDDAGLIMHAHDPLTVDQTTAFFQLIERRARHEPIAYITGTREFWSLDFHVTPDVLIPRGDSECLIDAVLSRRAADQPWSILDLGVGSGCLLCALLHEMPVAHGVGVDVSQAALKIAAGNAKRHGLEARTVFTASDWGKGIDGPFDIIISNPPYIREDDRPTMPLDVTGFEPANALFAGKDGMTAYRAILADIPRLLVPGGLLVFEAGDGHADRLAQLTANSLPGIAVEIVNDLKGRPRGVIADGKSFTEKD